MNQIAHEFEQNRTELDGSELVAELIHSFLLPEVEKFSLRERVRLSQRRHLVAAHNALYDETKPLMDGDDDVATRDENV